MVDLVAHDTGTTKKPPSPHHAGSRTTGCRWDVRLVCRWQCMCIALGMQRRSFGDCRWHAQSNSWNMGGGCSASCVDGI